MKAAVKKPVRTISAGAVSIPIYATAKGYMAKWTIAGEPHRADRVRLGDLIEEVQRVACAIDAGRPVDVEASLRRDLEYYRELETKLGSTPLHVAVDAYIATHRRRTLKPHVASLLATEYVARKTAAGRSTAYVRSLGVYLKKFTDRFGAEQIHEITSDTLADWISGLPGSPRYRANIQGAIFSFFRWCRDEKKALPQEIKTEAEFLEEITVKRKKAEIYSPGDFRKILLECPGRVRDVVAIAGFCGVRMSEITAVDTDHPPLPISAILFDFDAVRVGEQKVQSKGDRLVPLPACAKGWLDGLQGETGPVWPGGWINYQITQACKRAGVAYLRNGFRKSWITYRMAIVRNANQVADEAGNSPEEIYKSYRRPELIHVAEEWFNLFRPGFEPAPDPPDTPSSKRGARSRKK